MPQLLSTYINNGDFTEIVRNYFTVPPAIPYLPQKIWTKTKKLIINERPNDLWEKHYKRRKENDSKGYQSVIGEKYKPLGDEIILDTCDLVLNTMSKCLDAKIRNRMPFNHHYSEGKHEKNHTATLTSTFHKTAAPKPSVEKRSSSSGLAGHRQFPKVHSYQEIKQYLDESKSIVRRVHAGLSYEEYVRKRLETNCNKQKDSTVQGNDMVLVSLTNLQLGLPDIYTQKVETKDKEETRSNHGGMSYMIDPDTNKRVSVDPLTYSMMKEELIANKKILKMPMNQCLMAERHLGKNTITQEQNCSNQLFSNPGVTMRKERLRRDHLQYLQALFMILTSINNMRTTDIKTKIPLRLDVVQALRKEQTTESSYRRESKSRNSSKTGTGKMYQLQDTIEQTSEDSVCNQRESEKLMDIPLQSKIIMKALSWKRTKRNLIPHDDSTLSANEYSGFSTAHIQSNTLADQRRKSADPKSQTLWQLVAIDKSPKILQEKIKKTALEPEKIVSSNKMAMLKVKQDLLKDLKGELQRIDREKLAVFKMKYGELHDLSPVFEQHMSRFRNCSTRRTTHRKMVITDVPPSKWFEDLCEKTLYITGENSDDEEMNEILNDIGRYSTIDSKTFPSAKAKLCLLLMSLPANELFTIPVQRALKFVLEAIFQGEEHLLREWFQHRKIPYFIKEVTAG